MAEIPEPIPDADIPEATADSRKSRWAPLVWVVPLLAAGIGAWLVIHTMLNLGTSIQITFKSGEGLEANRTRIKYKDIDIGIVKSIELTAERDVLVKAEITPKAKHLDRRGYPFLGRAAAHHRRRGARSGNHTHRRAYRHGSRQVQRQSPRFRRPGESSGHNGR